tara:strand:+ start:6450 stop:7505 length:1056 start_codon:yes stop_codon:yes gene_type:complete
VSLTDDETEEQLEVVILYGGDSPEHDVSRTSALHVVKAIDLRRYKTHLIAIDKSGLWYEFKRDLSSQDQYELDHPLPIEGAQINPVEYLYAFNPRKLIVFPVLHGPNGEDGTMQGFLELFNIAYVGSGVLSSALCMDKIKCKELLYAHNVPQTKWVSLHRNSIMDLKEDSIDLDGDLFIKPANMGSSIGISKVTDRKNLKAALREAAKYDEWLIIEEAIRGREIEVAILEDGEPTASVPGEITPGADFYDYEDKYEDGATLQIPAPLTEEEILKVQNLAIKVFKLLNCRDLARVDFFYKESEKEWLINEVNTMPGFTQISMYPKLWSATGVPYDELINCLLSDPDQKRFRE